MELTTNKTVALCGIWDGSSEYMAGSGFIIRPLGYYDGLFASWMLSEARRIQQ